MRKRCIMPQHITPQRSVPITSQNVTRFASTRRPAASYPANNSSRVPKPPTGLSISPNRHELTQTQPKSSMGSPRCASSQSSTARTPSGPMMRLPWRKSPCPSVTSSDGPGSWSASQHSANSNTGRGQSKPRYSRSISASSLAAVMRRSFGSSETAQSVYAGRDLAELTRQQRTGICELLVAQNFARNGLTFDPRHHESGAEIVLRLQYMQHTRRRHAGTTRKLHQPRLGIEPGRAPRCRAITLRRAAQDSADKAVGMLDVERPGLLAGAAGEPDRVGHAGRAPTPRRDAAPEHFLHHLPLNLAGRFSRKAETPSLKSSAAPATRQTGSYSSRSSSNA